MAKAIIKYSELIEDDGGFQQARKDFEDLGKDLVQSAKKLQGGLSSINPNSSDSVEKYREEVQQLQTELKKLKTAQSVLNKTEQEYNLHQEKKIALNQSNARSLVDLDKSIVNLKKDLSDLNKLEKKEGKLTREQTKERVKLKIALKETTSQYRDLEKEVISNSKADKKTIQLMKAKEVLQKENIKTIDEMQERMKALRVVVKSTDTTTEQGKETIKELNAEIDELSETLNENSDSWIQNKNNIGNYKNDILEAMEGSSLFASEIGALNFAMSKLVGALKGNTEATESNTKATIKNSKAMKVLTKAQLKLTKVTDKAVGSMRTLNARLLKNSKAYRGLTKAVKGARKGISVLNKVAKATVIIALIGVILSLVQMFKQGRDGAIKTATTMKKLEGFVQSLMKAFQQLVPTIKGMYDKAVSYFQKLGAKMNKFGKEVALVGLEIREFFATGDESNKLKDKISKTEKEIKNLESTIVDLEKVNKDATAKMESGWNGVKGAFEKTNEAYGDMADSIRQKFKNQDLILSNEFEILRLQKEIEEQEIIGGDDTRSLNDMITALSKARKLREEMVSLEQANARIKLKSSAQQSKVDIKANLELMKNIKGVTQAQLEEGQALSEFKLSTKNVEEYANRVRALMQDLSDNTEIGTLESANPFSDEPFQEMMNVQKEMKDINTRFSSEQQKNLVEEKKAQRDIFEQNLDLLIDGFDKTIQRYEQAINDPNISLEKRMSMNEKFVTEFKENSKKELGEFNDFFKKVAKEGDDIPNLDLKFNEDGSYELFADGTQIGLDNITELNEQLQSMGIAEIPINRLREVIQQQEDFARGQVDINNQFIEDTITKAETLANVGVEKKLTEKLKLVSERAKKLQTEFDNIGTSTERKEAIIKEFEEIEDEKTKLEEDAEKERVQNRINALKDSLKKLADEDSVEGVNMRLEIAELEKSQIEDIDAPTLEVDADVDTSLVEEKMEKLSETINQVLDKVVDVHKERLKMAEEQVSKQDEMISKQEKRAREGLTNNLKFEKEQLAKREKEKIEAEKRLRKAEMVKSLYASYTANSKNEKNQGDALVQTIKDFAILRTIEASFGDGGLIADKVPTDGKGIIRGRSHRGQNGGIPVLVEGNEGIFSGSEINNMGKDNFYALKDLAGRGVMPKDMFKRHRAITERHVPMFQDSRIVSELRDVKNAIANQPNQQIDVSQLVNGMVQVSETITTGNKTIRNHHQVKRARL